MSPEALVLILPIALVGTIFVVHRVLYNWARFLPRPLSCPFCMSLWAAMVLVPCYYRDLVSAAAAFGMACFAALLMDALSPED